MHDDLSGRTIRPGRGEDDVLMDAGQRPNVTSGGRCDRLEPVRVYLG